MADTMWPLTLDLTRDECRGILRRSELETYSSVVGTFRAQGALDDTKARLLRELRNILHITDDRHKAEARRVANDEQLCTVAEMLAGPNTGLAWSKEGHRSYPLLHRAVPQTALLSAANDAQAHAQHINQQLPQPHHSQRTHTLDQLLAIDERTPVVIADQHAPVALTVPKPPALPAGAISRKPLLKRTPLSSSSASMAFVGVDDRRHHNYDLTAASANMRIQELYHQHANTPLPLPMGHTTTTTNAQLYGLIADADAPSIITLTTAADGSSNSSILLSPNSNAYHPHTSLLPNAPQPLQSATTRRTPNSAAIASKRTPKSTGGTSAASHAKTVRANKSQRAAAAATPRSGGAAAARQSKQNSGSSSAAKAPFSAELAYGSSLKSRKLSYPMEKPQQQHQQLHGETFPGDVHTIASSPSSIQTTNIDGQTTTTTFLWPPPPPQQHHLAPANAITIDTTQQQHHHHHYTLSNTSTGGSDASFPPLTQNSPVQVVFTSSTVEMLPAGDSMQTQPNNFITESTPITWVTDDVTLSAPVTPTKLPTTTVTLQPLVASATDQQSHPIVVPIVHSSPLLFQQQQQQSQQLSPVILQTTAATSSRPIKMIVQTPRKGNSATAATTIVAQPQSSAGKPTKMVRTKKAIQTTNAAADPMPLLSLQSTNNPSSSASLISPSTATMPTDANKSSHNKQNVTVVSSIQQHPPIPANLQQLLDTSLQIHSITSRQPQHNAVQATKSANTLSAMQMLNASVHKIAGISKTTQSPATPSLQIAPSTIIGGSGTKPKIQITHQEIIKPPPTSLSSVALASSAVGGGLKSIGVGTINSTGLTVGQLKTMQSKGNVKLIQSANGNIVLKSNSPGEILLSATAAGTTMSSTSITSTTTPTIGGTAAAQPKTPTTATLAFPKIQLVKARPGSSGTIGGTLGPKMVIMQKLPSGGTTFSTAAAAVAAASAASAASAAAAAAAAVPVPQQQLQLTSGSTAAGPTLTTLRGTVKLLPLKPLNSPAKMLLVSAAGLTTASASLSSVSSAAISRAKTIGSAAAGGGTSAGASVKITEDTPVDILPAEIGSNNSSSSIVLKTIANPTALVSMDSTTATGSAIVVPQVKSTTKVVLSNSNSSAIKRKLSPAATVTVGGSLNTSSSSGTTTAPEPKRIRIETQKARALRMSSSATAAVAPSQALPTVIIDWEKELDEQAKRNQNDSVDIETAHTLVKMTEPTKTAAADATTDAELFEEGNESGGAGGVINNNDDSGTTTSTADQAIYSGDYMAMEDDIIQYEGDDGEDIEENVSTTLTDNNKVATSRDSNGDAVISSAASSAAAGVSREITATTTAAATNATDVAADREEGEASEEKTIVMRMEEFDENGQSHMRDVSLEELVDSGHILME